MIVVIVIEKVNNIAPFEITSERFYKIRQKEAKTITRIIYE